MLACIDLVQPPPLIGKCTGRFPLESVRPLPGPAGSVICWQGNTIHWGSKCGEYAETPRMSIAMSFRVAKALPQLDAYIIT